MDTRVKKIVVVGGGTAGWLSALTMLQWLKLCGVEDARVSLVESADIGIIGVGEATQPELKTPLQFLGITEQQFIRGSHAAFKNGIKFVNWRDDPKKVGDHYYYHPFGMEQDVDGLSAWDFWFRVHQDHGLELDFARTAFRTCILLDHLRAPKLAGSEHYKSVTDYKGATDYAYHIDAALFGKLLKEVGIQRGVHHTVDKVVDVDLDERGFIRGVKTAEHGSLEGDLFIDCSGFRGVLINEVLKVDFVSYSDTLFCDRAVTIRVPFEEAMAPINPFTTSTARKAGWTWEVHLGRSACEGTIGRRGIGYVYSSQFISDDEAERELREYVGPAAHGIDTRLLRMRVGRNKQFWVKNCVAVGLSAGFIEPLEATGITQINMGLRQLMQNFPNLEFPPSLAESYNDTLARWFETVHEFIILHYKITQREDTEFWKANKHNDRLPERLALQLEYWRHRPPGRYDNDSGFRVWPNSSYKCILAGMNYLPERIGYAGQRPSPATVQEFMDRRVALRQSLLASCPDHRQYLERIFGSVD